MNAKQHDRIRRNAFWRVLINCPEDEPDYKQSKRRITQIMSVYFIHEKRLDIELFKQLVDYVDHICEKSYNRAFKDCPDDMMDDILYIGFQKYLSTDHLLSFYQHVIEKKPVTWCEKCRRYSTNTVC